MAAKKKSPEEPPPAVAVSRGWAETRDWHRWDRWLRQAGFRIKSRPRKGHTLWERGGITYTDEDARLIYAAELG